MVSAGSKNCRLPAKTRYWEQKNMNILAVSFLMALLSSATPKPETLDVYVIDVEGGKAMLVKAPSGQSMLVDAGWPGFNGRDVDRIIEAAKTAKLKKIDYLVITPHGQNIQPSHTRLKRHVLARTPLRSGTLLDR